MCACLAHLTEWVQEEVVRNEVKHLQTKIGVGVRTGTGNEGIGDRLPSNLMDGLRMVFQ